MNNFPHISCELTGKNIRRLMDISGYTVKDLQNEFGFEYPQAIYKWLHGESLPTIDNLVILAVLFKTTIDKIIVIDTK